MEQFHRREIAFLGLVATVVGACIFQRLVGNLVDFIPHFLWPVVIIRLITIAKLIDELFRSVFITFFEAQYLAPLLIVIYHFLAVHCDTLQICYFLTVEFTNQIFYYFCHIVKL